MSEDEFDNLPDDFADMQGVDWTQLLAGPTHDEVLQTATMIAGPSNSTIPPVSQRQSSVNGSTDYFDDFGDMDSTFLEELNRLEQNITQHPLVVVPSLIANPSRPVGNGNQPSSPRQIPEASTLQTQSGSINQTSPYFSVSNIPQKRKEACSDDSADASNVLPKRPCLSTGTSPVSSKSRGKMKEIPYDLQEAFQSYEDELTCPICCDIFVSTHIGNPCGHSYCGDCGWQWHVKNKHQGCPVCRTTLSRSTPMIPNILMDNLVEKHIKALSLAGNHEWASGGVKYQEWDARREAWKQGLADRKKPPQMARSFIPVQLYSPHDAGLFLVQDDVMEDPTYVDGNDGLIPRPIRRRHRRRGETVINVG